MKSRVGFGASLCALLIAFSSVQPSAASPLPIATTAAIDWKPCPPPPPDSGLPDGGQECASISVPLDYRSPNGTKINVGISRIKAADPSSRRGVLLNNPGGPGGPGIEMPRILTILLPQSVLDRYDLIGFDPRGIGTSFPVTCGLSSFQQEQSYVPLEQPGGKTPTVNLMHTVADSCAQNVGAALPFITTANTARDMDRIRQALGEAKFSYFAYSYGTYLGAVYASLFPNRTDRFVLDSNVDTSAIWREQFREWGPGGALRFPDFLEFASDNHSTYHLGSTPLGVRHTYFDLIEQLKANPIVLPTSGTLLNDAMFRELSFGALYSDASFPDGAEFWRLIAEGATPAEIEEVASVLGILEVPDDNGTAAGLSIVCNDVAWSRSVEQYRSEFASDSTLFPAFGPLGSNLWPCAFWPNQPIEAPTQITSNGPANILMVQNLRDPATPYSGALNMHAALGARSRLVSVNEGGHAIVGFIPNACANDAAINYLAFGVFPTTDKFCPKETQTLETASSPALNHARRYIARSPLNGVAR